uniref:Histidine kinase n=1 Tax=Thermosphaera aggregans TaxID=54254 RepID=A0A7C2FEG3_9CREN
MVGNNVIVISVGNGQVSSLASSEKLLVYDMDSRKIIAEIPSPGIDVNLLEELLEEYDASILVSAGIPEESALAIEEGGVKVHIVKPVRIEEFLEGI